MYILSRCEQSNFQSIVLSKIQNKSFPLFVRHPAGERWGSARRGDEQVRPQGPLGLLSRRRLPPDKLVFRSVNHRTRAIPLCSLSIYISIFLFNKFKVFAFFQWFSLSSRKCHATAYLNSSVAWFKSQA